MLLVSKVARLFLVLVLTSSVLSQTTLSKQEKKAIADFEKRAKAYIALRDRVKKRTPVVKKDATPTEIETYKDTLQKAIIAARAGAKQGDIFSPAVAPVIKRLIKTEFTDFEKSDLRKTVLEADTKGVPIKVNVAYPESKELVLMPPNLLLVLPQIPKDLRYRFVGRSLVLLDRDGSLILDFLRDALP